MRRLACAAQSAVGLGGSWVLALLVATGCTPLQEVKTGECGNGFVEPTAGEECDDPERDDCGAPGTSFECRLVCVEGTCQEGYICGGDGRCRKPSGRLELLGSSSQGYDVLRFADFDGDGRDDLMGTSSAAGLLDVHYLSFEGAFAQTASMPWSTSSPFAPVGDFTGDDYADLVAPTNAGFGLVLGWFDRSFQPLVATLPAAGAQDSVLVDALVQRPPPSYYAGNAGDPSMGGASSSMAADVLLLLQKSSNATSLVLRSPFGIFSPEAAQFEQPFLFEAPPGTSLEGVVVADVSAIFQAVSCPEVVIAHAGSTKLDLQYLCTADGLPNTPGVQGFVPPGGFDFGGPITPSGKAFYVEVHNLFVPDPQLFLDKAPAVALPGAEGGLVVVPILKDAFSPSPLPIPYPAVAFSAEGLEGEVLHVSSQEGALRVITSMGLFQCVGDAGGPPSVCSALQMFPFSPRSVTLADIDGDAKDDVVALVDGDATGGAFIAVGLTVNDGLELFALPSPGPIDQVGVGDVDGDFIPDLVTTTDVGTDPAGQTVRALTLYYGTGAGGFEAPSFPAFFPTNGSRILMSDFFPYYGDGLADPVVLSHPHDGGNVSFSPAAGDPSRLLLTPFVSLSGAPYYGVAANLYEGADAAPGALDLLALTYGDTTALRMMVKPTVQNGAQVYPDYLAEHDVDLAGPDLFYYEPYFASFGIVPKGVVVPREDGTDGVLLFVPAACGATPDTCLYDGSVESVATLAYWITSGSVNTTDAPKSPVSPLAGSGELEGYTLRGLVRDAAMHDVDADGAPDLVFLLETSIEQSSTYTVHILYGANADELSLAATEAHTLPPELLGQGKPTSLGVLDIDGDGRAEVLVNGEPAPGVFDTVRVHTGPDAPPPDAYEWVRWGAHAMISGDVNDDEVADLVVSYVGSGGLTKNGFTQIYVATAEQPGGQ